jgi:hypothetical protein
MHRDPRALLVARALPRRFFISNNVITGSLAKIFTNYFEF